MSGPVLSTISNNSEYTAVISEISSNNQVTGGFLVDAGASIGNLDLAIPTRDPTGLPAVTSRLLLGTCRGLFNLYQEGPIIVGAASRFELKADAGIAGNDPHEIPLAFSDTPGWSLEVNADGMIMAEPGGFANNG